MKKNLLSDCIICLICIAFLTSCAEYGTGKILKKFMNETVSLPKDMHSVQDRSMSSVSNFDKRPTFVIYHDSLACNTCQIIHMTDNIKLYERADTSDFQVVTVFSPRQEEYDEVMRQLMILDFPYPVYVDFNCSFRKLNTGIPEDVRFHSFLLDKNGHPVFVGNPNANETLNHLFEKVLSGLK